MSVNKLKIISPTSWQRIVILVLFILGLGIRLIDLSDAPFDVQPLRQSRDALIARNIYYNILPETDPQTREKARAMANGILEYEPPILERLSAYGYLLVGSEQLWVPRLLSSIFWVLGGVGLYALISRVTSSRAALIGTAYYLFLPFSISTSRSFQPEGLMVTMFVFSMFCTYRWAEEQNWKWAIINGIISGLAILVKAVAAFVIGGMMIGVVLSILGFRKSLSNLQVWVMGIIMVLIPSNYYIFMNFGTSEGFFINHVISLMPLLIEPSFYINWLKRIYVLNPIALAASLPGIFIAVGTKRWMLAGLFGGYLLYGFSLPHPIASHGYYHIQLVPIVALALSYTTHKAITNITDKKQYFQIAFYTAIIFGFSYFIWDAGSTMLREDHSAEPPYWEQIGELIPDDGDTIGLVQYFGMTIRYYGWKRIRLWPNTGQQQLAQVRGHSTQDVFAEYFNSRTEGMKYFLVTATNQFDKQEELKDYLYTNFPILAEGTGYLLFDLSDPLDQTSP
ncbi:MAG: phospholipid carrier-dependent glycosyltransferase [Chloroflexi bacterium]|nr:phospholipid carrier-dependent glycosyltransferase [Chloroflexota bacterium]